MKECLCSYPILRPIDYNANEARPLIIKADGWPYAGGGYLGQDDEEVNLFVNRYISFTFPPTVRNYGSFKRELFSMVNNLKIVRYRVHGCRLINETDRLPLIGFLNSPDLIDPTIVRWIAFIKLFNPEIRHVKGKENVLADALSRKKDHEELPEEEDQLVLSFNVHTRTTMKAIGWT
jgi:hypothetical protein